MRLETKVFFSILLLVQVAFAIKTSLEVFDDEFVASIEKNVTELNERLPRYTYGLFDRHINIVQAMFRNFFLTTMGQWSLLQIWIGGFLPTLVWMNMEQERTGMLGAAFYFVAYQFGSISIFYPLFCIYFLFSVHKSSSKANFANPLSSALQVISIALPIFGFMFLKSRQAQDNLFVCFLLAPSIVPIISRFIFPKLKEVTPQRSNNARFYYIATLGFAAAVGFCLHLVGVILTLRTYGPIDDFEIDQFYEDMLSNKVQYFMLASFTITYLTTFLMVLANGGFLSFVLVLLGSVAFGPAVPLALFYIKLELGKVAGATPPPAKKTD